MTRTNFIVEVVKDGDRLRFKAPDAILFDQIAAWDIDLFVKIRVERDGLFFDEGEFSTIGTHAPIEFFSGFNKIYGVRRLYSLFEICPDRFKEGDKLIIFSNDFAKYSNLNIAARNKVS